MRIYENVACCLFKENVKGACRAVCIYNSTQHPKLFLSCFVDMRKGGAAAVIKCLCDAETAGITNPLLYMTD